MIDAEVKIFNRVHAKVAPLCADKKFVSTVIVENETSFPAASLIEMDNRILRDFQTSTPIENFALVTYQLDVYATSKRECRNVFEAADETMVSMNFCRISGMYINYPTNTKLFRYTARYDAIIDRNGNIYRR